MSATAVKAAETTAMATQPIVYSVAGATFMGITVQDWVLIGTALLLCFNLAFAAVKAWDLIRRKPNGD